MINDNPFSSNRAEYMKDLWRYYVPNNQINFGTLRPIIVEGGRGTGKTTLFLCNCWKEKYAQDKCNGGNGVDGIIAEGIIGLYYKVDPVFVTAMKGKGKDESFWDGIFNTYLSIEILNELFGFLQKAEKCGKLLFEDIKKIAQVYYQLLEIDEKVDILNIESMLQEGNWILDEIENVMNYSEYDDNKIRRTAPGTIIKQVVGKLREISLFNNVAIKIYIDEFECLSKRQQCIINTLIKRSNNEIVYSIGAKIKGIKSYDTIVEEERLQRTHDYEYFVLDLIIADGYSDMLKDICKKRLHYFKEKLGNECKIISDDIETYLGRYSIDEELERYRKREKPGFYKKLEELIKQESNDENIIKTLCLDAEPMEARLHLSLLLRNKKYKPSIQELYNCYLEAKAGKKSKNAEKYKDWEHNAKSAIMFLLPKEYRMHKWYYGFDTYVALSSGIIRLFLELCEQTFNIAIQNGYLWSEQSRISPELQTRAASYVSRQQIMQIGSYSVCGSQMMIFTQSLGELFKELHRNSNLTLGEPEPNHFSVNTLVIDEKVINDLNNAIQYSILQELPETKGKENIHTNVIDYHFNKIFAPFFEISYFKKRKLELSSKFIASLMSDDEKKAKNAIKEYLHDYWRNKTCIEQTSYYEQIVLFDYGDKNE